jgi:hypothetical protein
MFNTQNSSGGVKVTGVGENAVFFSGGAPTLYFYRAGYFYASFGGKDDEAVMRSTAQQIDGTIQRLTAAPAPAATATRVPPQSQAQPTATQPTPSNQGVKRDADPEEALNEALRNNPFQVLRRFNGRAILRYGPAWLDAKLRTPGMQPSPPMASSWRQARNSSPSLPP